jgi:NAD(P)-dependent dehydrogenase (short-subunit alcohol dehydrogenase family)
MLQFFLIWRHIFLLHLRDNLSQDDETMPGGNMKIADLFRVEGQVAVITGGASGIGFACAEVLAENGAKVCLVDRNSEKAQAAADRLAALSGERPLTMVADAASFEDMKRAVADIIDAHGRIDIAFINAGIGGGPGFLDMEGRRNPNGAVENLDDQFWYGHVRNNMTSVFASLKSVVPVMRAQGSGSIIVTTSVAAVKVENFVCTPYQVAKAGAAHLVRQTALEMARYGVRVNSIAPGAFQTNIANGRMMQPEVAKRFANANPMGRMAQPSEIKGLALFLASRASSYVTGAQLVIDGGGSLGVAD